jgi:hypothetical protein
MIYVKAPNGKILNRSRNLAGIRRYVSKDPITTIELHHRPDSKGVLKLTLYSGATFETDFQSYQVMKDFVTRWRNAHGVPVKVFDSFGKEIGYSHEKVKIGTEKTASLGKKNYENHVKDPPY